jgi:hypothetical protein
MILYGFRRVFNGVSDGIFGYPKPSGNFLIRHTLIDQGGQPFLVDQRTFAA